MRKWRVFRFLMGRRCGSLVGAISLSLLLVAPARSLVRAYQSSSFKQTAGTVLSIGDMEEWDYNVSRWGYYVVNAPYVYHVGGRAYYGHRIRFLGIATKGWAAATVADFPVGSHPNVYYNPLRPSESVLEPGLTYPPALLM